MRFGVAGSDAPIPNDAAMAPPSVEPGERPDHCLDCGRPVPAAARYCPDCGVRLPETPPGPQPGGPAPTS